MSKRADHAQPNPVCVRCLIHMYHNTQLTVAEQAALAEAMVPYLARAQAPWPEAVRKIAANYLRDGGRVQRLIHSPDSAEWQAVLRRVISYAVQQSCFSSDSDATTWSDLDVYSDIQHKLASYNYNFESNFDHWLTATVVNWLRRFHRDRQSKCAGELSSRTKT